MPYYLKNEENNRWSAHVSNANSEQKITCFCLWPTLSKHWTHLERFSKNNAHLCSMSFLFVEITFGAPSELIKMMMMTAKETWRIFFENWTTPERSSPSFLISGTALIPQPQLESELLELNPLSSAFNI